MMKCCIYWLGINHIRIDRENHRIILKGDVINNPFKVLERLQKKYNKNVELISPKPKPENKHKNEPQKKEQVNFFFLHFYSITFKYYILIMYFLLIYYYKQVITKIVILKMYIHCEGCASDVKRKIEKMEGSFF